MLLITLCFECLVDSLNNSKTISTLLMCSHQQVVTLIQKKIQRLSYVEFLKKHTIILPNDNKISHQSKFIPMLYNLKNQERKNLISCANPI